MAFENAKPCWILTVYSDKYYLTVGYQGTLLDYVKENRNDAILFAQKITFEDYMLIEENKIRATPPHYAAKNSVYDRKEQRAIGHFLEMVKTRAQELHEKSPDKSTYYCTAMEQLQEEHFCYD